MGWWVSVVGGAVILLALWDVFHSLWHPTGKGLVSRSVMTGIWRLSRDRSRRVRNLAGPVAMATAIGGWFALVLLGGTLVYWPHVPAAFRYDAGLDPGGFVEAFYLSVVTTTTLGFGDIVPTAAWLRVVVPFQALTGFVLLTAAVSWVLQVYPALARRRSLALHLAALGRAGAVRRLDSLTAPTAARLLDGVTAALTQVRVDLTEYAESYYFAEESPSASLALTVRHAVDLAATAAASPHPDVRLAGDLLGTSIDDFAEVVDDLFLHTGGDRADVLAAYSAQHAEPHARAT